MNLPTWPMIGLHGENDLNYRGWTVTTHGIGHDPTHHSGHDYTPISRRGRIPIARLNNGYGTQGTIPLPTHYREFAQRCANWVAASEGCNIWIVGNEPNHAQERPDEVPILPDAYAICYDHCRSAIRSVPGHEQDLVLLAPVGPWNPQTTYEGNPHGDWLRYFQDLQMGVQVLDGFALHVYAREQTPAAVRRRAFMRDPPWQTHHWAFGILDDWMDKILPRYRDRPCFVTECNAYEPWQNVNTGFCAEAVLQAYTWNKNNPNRGQIRAFCFYRWAVDQWTIQDKPQVVADFLDAAGRGLTCPQATAPQPDPEPEQWAITVTIDAASTHGRRRTWQGALTEVT